MLKILKTMLILSVCYTNLYIKISAAVEAVKIPSKIKFADMELVITSAGKELIQQKIDTIISNEKLFQKLLHRVLLYMPMIEKVLREEGMPDDFKYMPIQESAMISTADDTKSLGFWQFKEGAAIDVKLRMDNSVDERVHIIESTRGAAKYLKSHYKSLNNWLLSLLSYNRGRGWVEQNGFKRYSHKRRVNIDERTHWYIIHYIAHKLVFEKHLKKNKHPDIHLVQHKNASGKTIKEIANHYKVDEDLLKEYIKWLKVTTVPTDKNYSIIVPLQYKNASQNSYEFRKIKSRYDYGVYLNTGDNFPVIHINENYKKEKHKVKINGLWGVIAGSSDTLDSMAILGEISKTKFIEINEISDNHQVISGHPYYFEKKNRSASIHFHIVREGDSWWSVSQKYGVKKSSLQVKNRESSDSDLKPGRVLWLRFIRPKIIDSEHLED